jgi:hypothetical protein
VPDETLEQEFRIPKSAVKIFCHTVSGEKLDGEIFLDAGPDASARQIADLFNSERLFLPIKTAAERQPRLLSKNAIAFVETGRFLPDIRKEPTAFLTKRKMARFMMDSFGTIDAEILIDTPADQARVQDVLNLANRFLSVLFGERYCLINTNRILEVQEL